MKHRYADGYAAALADGWCLQCFRQERLPGKSMCAVCGDKRNVRSRNRNDAHFTTHKTRKRMQDVFPQGVEEHG